MSDDCEELELHANACEEGDTIKLNLAQWFFQHLNTPIRLGPIRPGGDRSVIITKIRGISSTLEMPKIIHKDGEKEKDGGMQDAVSGDGVDDSGSATNKTVSASVAESSVVGADVASSKKSRKSKTSKGKERDTNYCLNANTAITISYTSYRIVIILDISKSSFSLAGKNANFELPYDNLVKNILQLMQHLEALIKKQKYVRSLFVSIIAHNGLGGVIESNTVNDSNPNSNNNANSDTLEAGAMHDGEEVDRDVGEKKSDGDTLLSTPITNDHNINHGSGVAKNDENGIEGGTDDPSSTEEYGSSHREVCVSLWQGEVHRGSDILTALPTIKRRFADLMDSILGGTLYSEAKQRHKQWGNQAGNTTDAARIFNTSATNPRAGFSSSSEEYTSGAAESSAFPSILPILNAAKTQLDLLPAYASPIVFVFTTGNISLSPFSEARCLLLEMSATLHILLDSSIDGGDNNAYDPSGKLNYRLDTLHSDYSATSAGFAADITGLNMLVDVNATGSVVTLPYVPGGLASDMTNMDSNNNIVVDRLRELIEAPFFLNRRVIYTTAIPGSPIYGAYTRPGLGRGHSFHERKTLNLREYAITGSTLEHLLALRLREGFHIHTISHTSTPQHSNDRDRRSKMYSYTNNKVHIVLTLAMSKLSTLTYSMDVNYVKIIHRVTSRRQSSNVGQIAKTRPQYAAPLKDLTSTTTSSNVSSTGTSMIRDNVSGEAMIASMDNLLGNVRLAIDTSREGFHWIRGEIRVRIDAHTCIRSSAAIMKVLSSEAVRIQTQDQLTALVLGRPFMPGYSNAIESANDNNSGAPDKDNAVINAESGGSKADKSPKRPPTAFQLSLHLNILESLCKLDFTSQTHYFSIFNDKHVSETMLIQFIKYLERYVLPSANLHVVNSKKFLFCMSAVSDSANEYRAQIPSHRQNKGGPSSVSALQRAKSLRLSHAPGERERRKSAALRDDRSYEFGVLLIELNEKNSQFLTLKISGMCRSSGSINAIIKKVADLFEKFVRHRLQSMSSGILSQVETTTNTNTKRSPSGDVQEGKVLIADIVGAESLLPTQVVKTPVMSSTSLSPLALHASDSLSLQQSDSNVGSSTSYSASLDPYPLNSQDEDDTYIDVYTASSKAFVPFLSTSIDLSAYSRGGNSYVYHTHTTTMLASASASRDFTFPLNNHIQVMMLMEILYAKQNVGLYVGKRLDVSKYNNVDKVKDTDTNDTVVELHGVCPLNPAGVQGIESLLTCTVHIKASSGQVRTDYYWQKPCFTESSGEGGPANDNNDADNQGNDNDKEVHDVAKPQVWDEVADRTSQYIENLVLRLIEQDNSIFDLYSTAMPLILAARDANYLTGHEAESVEAEVKEGGDNDDSGASTTTVLLQIFRGLPLKCVAELGFPPESLKLYNAAGFAYIGESADEHQYDNSADAWSLLLSKAVKMHLQLPRLMLHYKDEYPIERALNRELEGMLRASLLNMMKKSNISRESNESSASQDVKGAMGGGATSSLDTGGGGDVVSEAKKNDASKGVEEQKIDSDAPIDGATLPSLDASLSAVSNYWNSAFDDNTLDLLISDDFCLFAATDRSLMLLHLPYEHMPMRFDEKLEIDLSFGFDNEGEEEEGEEGEEDDDDDEGAVEESKADMSGQQVLGTIAEEASLPSSLISGGKQLESEFELEVDTSLNKEDDVPDSDEDRSKGGVSSAANDTGNASKVNTDKGVNIPYNASEALQRSTYLSAVFASLSFPIYKFSEHEDLLQASVATLSSCPLYTTRTSSQGATTSSTTTVSKDGGHERKATFDTAGLNDEDTALVNAMTQQEKGEDGQGASSTQYILQLVNSDKNPTIVGNNSDFEGIYVSTLLKSVKARMTAVYMSHYTRTVYTASRLQVPLPDPVIHTSLDYCVNRYVEIDLSILYYKKLQNLSKDVYSQSDDKKESEEEKDINNKVMGMNTSVATLKDKLREDEKAKSKILRSIRDAFENTLGRQLQGVGVKDSIGASTPSVIPSIKPFATGDTSSPEIGEGKVIQEHYQASADLFAFVPVGETSEESSSASGSTAFHSRTLFDTTRFRNVVRAAHSRNHEVDSCCFVRFVLSYREYGEPITSVTSAPLPSNSHLLSSKLMELMESLDYIENYEIWIRMHVLSLRYRSSDLVFPVSREMLREQSVEKSLETTFTAGGRKRSNTEGDLSEEPLRQSRTTNYGSPNVTQYKRLQAGKYSSTANTTDRRHSTSRFNRTRRSIESNLANLFANNRNRGMSMGSSYRGERQSVGMYLGNLGYTNGKYEYTSYQPTRASAVMLSKLLEASTSGSATEVNVFGAVSRKRTAVGDVLAESLHAFVAMDTLNSMAKIPRQYINTETLVQVQQCFTDIPTVMKKTEVVDVFCPYHVTESLTDFLSRRILETKQSTSLVRRLISPAGRTGQRKLLFDQSDADKDAELVREKERLKNDIVLPYFEDELQRNSSGAIVKLDDMLFAQYWDGEAIRSNEEEKEKTSAATVTSTPNEHRSGGMNINTSPKRVSCWIMMAVDVQSKKPFRLGVGNDNDEKAKKRDSDKRATSSGEQVLPPGDESLSLVQLSVQVQLCKTEGRDTVLEEEHEKIYASILKVIRKSMHTVNQRLLLEDLHDSKVASPYLLERIINRSNTSTSRSAIGDNKSEKEDKGKEKEDGEEPGGKTPEAVPVAKSSSSKEENTLVRSNSTASSPRPGSNDSSQQLAPPPAAGNRLLGNRGLNRGPINIPPRLSVRSRREKESGVGPIAIAPRVRKAPGARSAEAIANKEKEKDKEKEKKEDKEATKKRVTNSFSYLAFSPSQFACPRQDPITLLVHTNVGIALETAVRQLETFALSQFVVTNRDRCFVTRDEHGSVYYLTFTDLNNPILSNDKSEHDDKNAPVPTGSVSNIEKATAGNDNETAMAVSTSNHTGTDAPADNMGASSVGNHLHSSGKNSLNKDKDLGVDKITLHIYGIQKMSDKMHYQLRQLLHNRLTEYTAKTVSSAISRSSLLQSSHLSLFLRNGTARKAIKADRPIVGAGAQPSIVEFALPPFVSDIYFFLYLARQVILNSTVLNQMAINQYKHLQTNDMAEIIHPASLGYSMLNSRAPSKLDHDAISDEVNATSIYSHTRLVLFGGARSKNTNLPDPVSPSRSPFKLPALERKKTVEVEFLDARKRSPIFFGLQSNIQQHVHCNTGNNGDGASKLKPSPSIKSMASHDSSAELKESSKAKPKPGSKEAKAQEMYDSFYRQQQVVWHPLDYSFVYNYMTPLSANSPSTVKAICKHVGQGLALLQLIPLQCTSKKSALDQNSIPTLNVRTPQSVNDYNYNSVKIINTGSFKYLNRDVRFIEAAARDNISKGNLHTNNDPSSFITSGYTSGNTHNQGINREKRDTSSSTDANAVKLDSPRLTKDNMLLNVVSLDSVYDLANASSTCPEDQHGNSRGGRDTNTHSSSSGILVSKHMLQISIYPTIDMNTEGLSKYCLACLNEALSLYSMERLYTAAGVAEKLNQQVVQRKDDGNTALTTDSEAIGVKPMMQSSSTQLRRNDGEGERVHTADTEDTMSQMRQQSHDSNNSIASSESDEKNRQALQAFKSILSLNNLQAAGTESMDALRRDRVESIAEKDSQGTSENVSPSRSRSNSRAPNYIAPTTEGSAGNTTEQQSENTGDVSGGGDHRSRGNSKVSSEVPTPTGRSRSTSNAVLPQHLAAGAPSGSTKDSTSVDDTLKTDENDQSEMQLGASPGQWTNDTFPLPLSRVVSMTSERGDGSGSVAISTALADNVTTDSMVGIDLSRNEGSLDMANETNIQDEVVALARQNSMTISTDNFGRAMIVVPQSSIMTNTTQSTSQAGQTNLMNTLNMSMASGLPVPIHAAEPRLIALALGNQAESIRSVSLYGGVNRNDIFDHDEQKAATAQHRLEGVKLGLQDENLSNMLSSTMHLTGQQVNRITDLAPIPLRRMLSDGVSGGTNSDLTMITADEKGEEWNAVLNPVPLHNAEGVYHETPVHFARKTCHLANRTLSSFLRLSHNTLKQNVLGLLQVGPSSIYSGIVNRPLTMSAPSIDASATASQSLHTTTSNSIMSGMIHSYCGAVQVPVRLRKAVMQDILYDTMAAFLNKYPVLRGSMLISDCGEPFQDTAVETDEEKDGEVYVKSDENEDSNTTVLRAQDWYGYNIVDSLVTYNTPASVYSTTPGEDTMAYYRRKERLSSITSVIVGHDFFTAPIPPAKDISKKQKDTGPAANDSIIASSDTELTQSADTALSSKVTMTSSGSAPLSTTNTINTGLSNETSDISALPQNEDTRSPSLHASGALPPWLKRRNSSLEVCIGFEGFHLFYFNVQHSYVSQLTGIITGLVGQALFGNTLRQVHVLQKLNVLAMLPGYMKRCFFSLGMITNLARRAAPTTDILPKESIAIDTYNETSSTSEGLTVVPSEPLVPSIKQQTDIISSADTLINYNVSPLDIHRVLAANLEAIKECIQMLVWDKRVLRTLRGARSHNQSNPNKLRLETLNVSSTTNNDGSVLSGTQTVSGREALLNLPRSVWRRGHIIQKIYLPLPYIRHPPKQEHAASIESNEHGLSTCCAYGCQGSCTFWAYFQRLKRESSSSNANSNSASAVTPESSDKCSEHIPFSASDHSVYLLFPIPQTSVVMCSQVKLNADRVSVSIVHRSIDMVQILSSFFDPLKEEIDQSGNCSNTKGWKISFDDDVRDLMGTLIGKRQHFASWCYRHGYSDDQRENGEAILTSRVPCSLNIDDIIRTFQSTSQSQPLAEMASARPYLPSSATGQGKIHSASVPWAIGSHPSCLEHRAVFVKEALSLTLLYCLRSANQSIVSNNSAKDEEERRLQVEAVNNSDDRVEDDNNASEGNETNELKSDNDDKNCTNHIPSYEEKEKDTIAQQEGSRLIYILKVISAELGPGVIDCHEDTLQTNIVLDGVNNTLKDADGEGDCITFSDLVQQAAQGYSDSLAVLSYRELATGSTYGVLCSRFECASQTKVDTAKSSALKGIQFLYVSDGNPSTSECNMFTMLFDCSQLQLSIDLSTLRLSAYQGHSSFPASVNTNSNKSANSSAFTDDYIDVKLPTWHLRNSRSTHLGGDQIIARCPGSHRHLLQRGFPKRKIDKGTDPSSDMWLGGSVGAGNKTDIEKKTDVEKSDRITTILNNLELETAFDATSYRQSVMNLYKINVVKPETMFQEAEVEEGENSSTRLMLKSQSSDLLLARPNVISISSQYSSSNSAVGRASAAIAKVLYKSSLQSFLCETKRLRSLKSCLQGLEMQETRFSQRVLRKCGTSTTLKKSNSSSSVKRTSIAGTVLPQYESSLEGIGIAVETVQIGHMYLTRSQYNELRRIDVSVNELSLFTNRSFMLDRQADADRSSNNNSTGDGNGTTTMNYNSSLWYLSPLHTAYLNLFGTSLSYFNLLLRILRDYYEGDGCIVSSYVILDSWTESKEVEMEEEKERQQVDEAQTKREKIEETDKLDIKEGEEEEEEEGEREGDQQQSVVDDTSLPALPSTHWVPLPDCRQVKVIARKIVIQGPSLQTCAHIVINVNENILRSKKSSLPKKTDSMRESNENKEINQEKDRHENSDGHNNEGDKEVKVAPLDPILTKLIKREKLRSASNLLCRPIRSPLHSTSGTLQSSEDTDPPLHSHLAVPTITCDSTGRGCHASLQRNLFVSGVCDVVLELGEAVFGGVRSCPIRGIPAHQS